MKTCTQCKIMQPLSNYYKNRKRLGSCCKTCHKSNTKRTYEEKVAIVNNYKRNKGCAKCKDRRAYVLVFHHTDPKEKDYAISDKTRAPLSQLMKEINKCVVLCANCHIEFHHLERQDDLTIKNYLFQTRRDG